MPTDLRTLLNQRVVILDGGMGTSIHRHDPTPEDWGGEAFVNLSDMMNFSRPEWILDIHRGYFAAGCDAVETNTFNASRLVLGEFGVADRVIEFNRRGAELARRAADEFSTPDRPRFVVGSVGPGMKAPSLLNESTLATWDQLADGYRDQFRGLIEGGVDAILIETCFDILQAKCVVVTCLDVMRELGVKPVLMVQVTMERSGTMLAGTDMAGAITTLEAFPEIDVIGMNCATGPDLMLSHIRHLSQYCRRKISVLPNAGLPENVDGKTFFPLQPTELTDWLERFVTEFGVNIVGGCCGTTAEHLTEVCKRLHGRVPAPRTPNPEPAVSSLFTSVGLLQEPRPLLVGERTNTNGSKKFKELLAKEDWDGLVDMAREQEREEAHVIDVCTAYVGRDEVRDMTEVMKRFNAEITRPLMIDSTEVPVIEVALKLTSGKPIINSVNLEDGREKFDKIVGLARRYGAALVCGCIDEQGMARLGTRKYEVARRIYDICTQEYGIPAHDLIFDPLVLPISTGEEAERKNALELLEGIRQIKEKCPGALTIVGLSNASFGLSPYTRQVLNSVLLHYCLEAGLDAAILHAAKILPLSDIDDTGRELCRRLIFDDRSEGDPLLQLMDHYAGRKTAAAGGATATLGETVEERLKQAIIQGRRETLVADLDTARGTYSPLDIINKILLDGMKVVGELFGAGKMQLPFVLRSAEVMKAAVAYLQPFMEKAEGAGKGTIVLATVKGDVHDIGKNLVGIILSNNGYTVHDIGIKQPIENIVAAYQQHNADAIGMSGLLVKSTVVMKEDLLTLNQRGLMPPVILGGAALNRRYVEHDLRSIYKGELFYGEDAFEGLRVMDRLCAEKRSLPSGSAALAGLRRPKPQAATTNGQKPTAEEAACCPTHAAVAKVVRTSNLSPAPDLPVPPFLGSRTVTDISVEEVFGFINERTLISTQWQFRKNNVDPREYEQQMQDIAYPTLERLKRQCLDEGIMQPKVVYGFYRCAREGDDFVIYGDDGRSERQRYTFPRQNHGEFLCLSDYVRPLSDGVAVDSVAFMGVTAGPEVTRRCHELRASDQYTDYLFLHGLGVEFAEALAEFWHQRIRREWGIASSDATDVRKLFKKHYRGCRYAFGYPACPDLEDQAKLFELLDPQRIGLELSEQFMLEPEQSTTALIVHHPQAKYFNVTRGPVYAAAE